MINLMLGNCLERMAEIPDGSIDMVLTDPPYGTTQNKWDSIIPLEPMWKHLRRVTKPHGAIVITSQSLFTAHEDITVHYEKLPIYNPQKTKGAPYTKKNVSNGDGRNYGSFQRVGSVNKNQGDRFPRSVLKISNNNNSLHPTQKPVALMEYLIRTYTNPGETVLDFTMGSGTTGVASMKTGRRFIGIELDDKYFEIAQKRIADAMYSEMFE